MESLIDLLKAHQLTLSSCESFTGGLFSAKLTEIPGSSKVFKGSIVAYANDVKVSVVGIHPDIILTDGAISEACAIEMAKLTRLKLQSDVCIAFTGNAGPSSMENKAVGLWYCAIADETSICVKRYQSNASRNSMRQEAIELALIQLKAWIQEKTQSVSI